MALQSSLIVDDSGAALHAVSQDGRPIEREREREILHLDDVVVFNVCMFIPQTSVALGVLAVLIEDSILSRLQCLCAGNGLCCLSLPLVAFQCLQWSPAVLYFVDVCKRPELKTWPQRQPNFELWGMTI